jgi:methionyl-tRNA formyltransferase
MRIWFFGTPSLAATVLQDLISAPDMEVVFAVTNPDKPWWREQIMKPSPVKELALIHSLPVLQPTTVRNNPEFLHLLRSYNCDYFVVVAYGKIVPLELLHIPKKLCINVHGSILPAYRWASPIQAALLHGEKETGVTIMEMSEGMDEGDILKIRTISIDPTETSDTLFAKFADISWPTLIQTLRELERWEITPISQDTWIPVYAGMTETPKVTYCKKIDKEDGLIDWSLPAKEIYQKWQAYTPWPGVFTHYEGKRMILEKMKSEEWRVKSTEIIGQVVRLEDGQVGVVCGEWILTIQQLKLEWKKSQNIKDFVNGNQQFIWYNFL